MIVGTKGQIGHKGTEQVFAERDARNAAKNSETTEGATEKRGAGRPPKNSDNTKTEGAEQ